MDLRGDSQAAGSVSIPPRDSRAWELMFSGKDVMLIGENHLGGLRPKGLTSGMQPREGTQSQATEIQLVQPPPFLDVRCLLQS